MSDSQGRLARLIAVRDQLCNALHSCESTRDLPGLSREYRLVLGELAELDAKKETPDVIDQLAARRKAAPARRTAHSS